MTETTWLSYDIPSEDRDDLERELWSVVVSRKGHTQEQHRKALHDLVNRAVEAALRAPGFVTVEEASDSS